MSHIHAHFMVFLMFLVQFNNTAAMEAESTGWPEPPSKKVQLLQDPGELTFIKPKNYSPYKPQCTQEKLFDALYNEEHSETFERLITQNPDLPFVATLGNNYTLLHLTSAYGNDNATRRLIDAGAPVTALDSNGRMPLHWAALCGHGRVTTMLLNAGAPIMVVAYQDALDKTAMHFAAQEGFISIMQILLTHFCQRHPCISTTKLRHLIINKEDRIRHSPLLDAIQGTQVHAVRFLLQNGAVVHAGDIQLAIDLNMSAITPELDAIKSQYTEADRTHYASLHLTREELRAIEKEFGFAPLNIQVSPDTQPPSLLPQPEGHPAKQPDQPQAPIPELSDTQSPRHHGCWRCLCCHQSPTSRPYRIHPAPQEADDD